MDLGKGLFYIFNAKLVLHREHSDKTFPGTSIDKERLLNMIEEKQNTIDTSEVSDWAKKSWIKAIKKA